jgi:hypothetical protein
MYSRVMRIFNECDSRYPTAAEEATILEYASSIPQRLQIAALVEKYEQEAVTEAVEAMRRRYAKFHSLHDRGWEKTARDMQLCLRYAVQGMVVDDAEMPKEKLFAWLCTIVKGLGMTTEFSRHGYELLTESLRRKLPADSFTLLEPFLQRLIKDMSDYQEPSRPAVG